jgi:leucyl-tRNA synthetase
VVEKVVVAVQVNGKLRGTVEIDQDSKEGDVIVLASQLESVARHLDQKHIRRTIYVAGRTLNFVVD